MQHPVSVEALRYLEGETDAKGRRLEVLKMPCPPPLHITEEEAAGVAKIDGSKPRQVGGVCPLSFHYSSCLAHQAMPDSCIQWQISRSIYT